MEQCEKEIITKNLDKLIRNTICNTVLLATLQASGCLSDIDVNDLNALSSNSMEQVAQFYKLIQTKLGGYKILLNALKDTQQTGALSILNKIPSQYDNSFRFDADTNARLGKGKFGAVFKGELMNRLVAVKRIFHNDETEKARIENEVEILLKCDGHENIVRYFTTKNFEYFDLIVLEVCDMTLKQSIEHKIKVQIPRRKIMNKVTNGLEWLHEQKILYCNLKPENILLKKRPPRVKLTGFGASVQLKDGEEGCQVYLPEIPETLGFEAPEAKGNRRECTFASDVYSLGSLFCFVLTDGKSNLKELESLDLEDTMDETKEAKNFVDDILTIKNMTSDDPKSRPSSSQLLSTPMLRNCDETQETNDFNHTNDPPLLRFIKQIKIENENKINGIPSGKSNQPKKETTLKAEHKIEKIYQILENLKQMDPAELRKHGQLEKFKDAELRVFEKFTETVGAKLKIKVCKQDEEKNPYLMQKESKDEAIANDDSDNYESCDDSCFTELQEQESLITNSVGKVFPCVDDEQQEKIQQTLDELNEMDLLKTRIKLFELVKSEKFCIIKPVLNSLAAHMKITELCDDEERSLLHVAVKFREYDVVEYLVNERGFGNILHAPMFQNTLIHDCIEDIHTVDVEKFEQKHMILELLFTKHPLLIQSKNTAERTPLHIATDLVFSNGKQIEFIKMLLAANACVNAEDESDRTPLHLAVRGFVSENVSDIIQILIEHGAEPDAQDIIDYTFLHYAIQDVPPREFHEIVKHLVSIERTKSFHTHGDVIDTVLHNSGRYLKGDLLDETLQLFKTHGVNFNARLIGGNV
ncbi:unnamed protein product [Orchesella dallaii]|uniref:Protein kinase domain-containing protein n=1 Tax=Orchesella dallaii TaxID=48710 RepID=A0ABP1RQI1_9HEXA